MRTIRNLINPKRDIYIYLSDEYVKKRFEKDAEKENMKYWSDVVLLESGRVYQSGVKETQDIMMLTRDGRISFLGFCGGMEFENRCKSIFRKPTIIDYKKYVNGDKYFRMKAASVIK